MPARGLRLSRLSSGRIAAPGAGRPAGPVTVRVTVLVSDLARFLSALSLLVSY